MSAPNISRRRIYSRGWIRLKRRLSTQGKVLVTVGQRVAAEDALERNTVPGDFVIVNVAQALGLQPKTDNIDDFALEQYLQVHLNDFITQGDWLAERTSPIAYFSKRCRAPISGYIVAIAGPWVIIEAEETLVEHIAQVPGLITAISPGDSVSLDLVGAYIETTLVLGDEVSGVLQCISDSPTANIRDVVVSMAPTQPTILLVGGTITADLLWQLADTEVVGVIVGSIDASLLTQSLQPPMTIAVTEGCGTLPMVTAAWEILQSQIDQTVSICHLPPFDAPLNKGAIVIPTLASPDIQVSRTEPSPSAKSMIIGSHVRSLRTSEASVWGTISATRDKPHVIETGIPFWGADIHFPDRIVFIPWLNLETLEGGDIL